ncbi:MAG: NDP-sugar pyrophosphorylase family protein [Cyclobacteriaceae bacterium]|jgi:NDP-sugar pyrophosphorylase family protein
MNILITIWARGGSKGVPGKNIKLLAAKPLLQYTIETAQQFAKMHECAIVISTDSEEIKDVARKTGIHTEYTIERLAAFGIDDFWLSIGYLGEQIEDYFEDGSQKNAQITYIRQVEPLGTIGALSKIKNYQHDHILVSNSDILTNLDYEDFYNYFISTNSDFSVVTIPYSVDVPYAVLNTGQNNEIKSFEEKPTYTYYSNGDIYLMKREVFRNVPESTYYHATDLLEELIGKQMKGTSYPHVGYWLDIGKPDDFNKANRDIDHIQFQ